MRFRNVLFAGALALAACKGSSGGVSIPKGDLADFIDGDMAGNEEGQDLSQGQPTGDLAVSHDAGPVTPGTNVATLVVDDGPPSSQFGSYNAAFVSVKICASGTTNCATIDHVAIDTGSVGMRIQSSVIPSALLSALTVEKTGSKTVAECYTYADGFTWGSVRTADVSIGGETAAGMAFQIQGDSESTIPAACKSGGMNNNEDTVDAFGYNGIIGISGYGPDCGAYCETQTNAGQYYTCSGSTCAEATLSQSNQVKNPVFAFSQDNNGVIIALPDPGDSPAGTQTGTLTFGINTQANNQMGSSVNTYPEASGDISTQGYNNVPPITIAGVASIESLFDSGTTDLVFDDSSLKQCTGQDQGRYCPASKTAVGVTTQDGNGTSHQYSVNVTSADTLFMEAAQTDCAFKDIADPAGSNGKVVILGLPFFYGRTVFVGIDGTTITGQTPPFEAF